MIIFSMLIGGVFLLGALVLYTLCSYVELKGYERGLDEAEQIMAEVQNGNSSKDL